MTPFIGTTAQTPVTVNNGSATSTTVTGLQRWHRLHLQGRGDQRDRDRRAVGCLPRGHARGHDLRLRQRRTSSTPVTVSSGELGVKFTADTSGQIVGIRFYKAAANTGTHTGNLWSAAGTLLAVRDVHRRDRVGLADRVVLEPGHDHSRHDLHRELLRPQRPLFVQRRRARGRRSTTRRCTRSPIGPAPTASTSTARRARSRRTRTTPATTRSTCLCHRSRPPLSATSRRPAGHVSATVNWSAPAGGGATSYMVTPYIGSTAQTPVTVTGTPPATTARSPGSLRGRPTRSPSSPPTPTATVPPRRVELRHPDATGCAGSADRRDGHSGERPGAGELEPPTSNNGSAITGYTVTPLPGTTAQTRCRSSNASATSTTVTGLTNGTALHIHRGGD